MALDPNVNSSSSVRIAWRRTGGVLITAATVGLLEFLWHSQILPVQAPGTVLLLPVAYAAFVGGLGPGLLSAAVAIVYVAHFFSSPGALLHFTPDHFQRFLIASITTPAMAVLANVLRERGLLLAHEQQARRIAEEGRARVTNIIASITDGFFALDRDWRFTYINRKAGELLHADRDALVGQRFQEARHALHLPNLESEMARSMREGVTVELNEQDTTGLTWLSIHIYPSDEGLSVYLQDVTAQRRSEDARRISEARFTSIVSIASDAIISVDARQIVLNFNHGAEEIFGYSAGEVLGQPLDLLLPTRYQGAHGAHIEHFGQAPVSARRMAERREISGRRKNGEEFPAEASISKLQVGDSWIFTVVLRDITERKRYEKTQHFLADAGTALGSSLDVQKTLDTVAGLVVPEIADWCVIYNRDGAGGATIRSALAHSDPDIQSKLCAVGLHLTGTSESHPVHRVLRTGESVLMPAVTADEIRDMAQDEEYARLIIEIGTTSAIFVPMTARGEIIGAIGMFSSTSSGTFDEEDLALAQEIGNRSALALDNAHLYNAARAAIEARDDVLAVVSHDLGNPLSAIRIGTTLLLSSVPQAERETGGWKHIVGIRNSAEQMERLIKDLLEVKRIEAGQLSIERGRVAVAPLIAEAIELLTPIAEGKDVKLLPKVNGNVPALYADRERLLQTFSNLVGNAVKFTPEGGVVYISAEGKGSEVQLTVADTGIGISPEDAQHVFDRYWQAKSRRKGKQGIGLGLVIVKGIIEAHGGRVWMESEVGKGSSFHFTVPAWNNQFEE